MDDKVCSEQAVVDFDRFCELMDISVDPALMDDEDKGQFEKQKVRILRAVEKGSLIFNEDGEPIYTPSNKHSKSHDPITFHQRSGASLMAMDGKKKGHDVSKMYAVLGSMCKVPQSTFAGLVGADIKLCEALFALLMD